MGCEEFTARTHGRHRGRAQGDRKRLARRGRGRVRTGLGREHAFVNRRPCAQHLPRCRGQGRAAELYPPAGLREVYPRLVAPLFLSWTTASSSTTTSAFAFASSCPRLRQLERFYPASTRSTRRPIARKSVLHK